MLTPEQLKDIHYKVCHIDADSIPYKASTIAQKITYTLHDSEGNHLGDFKSAKDCKDYISDAQEFFDEDTSGWVRTTSETLEDIEKSYKTVDHIVAKIQKSIKADTFKYFLQGEGNFRKAEATLLKYKGERPEKPVYFNDVKSYMQEVTKASTISNLEVDDVVSVNLYNDFLKHGEDPTAILVYTDKDLLNTAGAHFNLDKEEFLWVTQEDADFNFARQMITGDLQVDNIQGLPDVSKEFREKYNLKNYKGVGKVTAEAILEDLKGKSLQVLYKRVLEAYESFYPDPYHYTSWDGKELIGTPESVLDENCTLLFMMRRKGEVWKDYKKRTFKK